MAKCFRDILTERYSILSKTVNRLEKEYACFPDGRVSVRHRKNIAYYYYVGADCDKYLGKDNIGLIKQLVQKAYISDVIRSAADELKLLDRFLKAYKTDPENVYDNLPEPRKKYSSPVIFADRNVIDWVNSPYVKKPIVNGFRTLKGDIVRSKSELIIADRLWLNGIPYKYECPIMINGQIIHPDFTILRRSDNKILYLEHCGMVDKPEYAESMVNRINDYNKEGITLGDRLFLSMETSATPLDVTAIDNLINTCFK